MQRRTEKNIFFLGNITLLYSTRAATKYAMVVVVVVVVVAAAVVWVLVGEGEELQ